MMIECKVEFNFNVDGVLEPEACEGASVPLGTSAEDLDEVQYNMVAEGYNLPAMNEYFTIDVNGISEEEISNELSGYFGWPITDLSFEEIDNV